MIHAVFILDASGVPILTWKSKKAPESLFKGKDDILIGSFITALLNFGQETFAAPQRIDFNGYALTFFSSKVNNRLYWIAAISDSKDHRKATINMLKDLSQRLAELLSEASPEEGVVFETSRIKRKSEMLIYNIIKKHLRFLPNIRSSPVKSFVFSLILSSIISFLLYNVVATNFFISIFSYIIGNNEFLQGALIISLNIIITGVIAGYLASRISSGFLSAYISSFITWILAGGVMVLDILFMITWAISFALIAGIIGAVIGFYADSRKLKIVEQPRILTVEEIEEMEGEIEVSEEELRELENI